MNRISDEECLKLIEMENKIDINHKKMRIKRFIDLGYSVKWIPDNNPRFDLFIPSNQQELRAMIVYDKDLNDGLKNSKITELVIELKIEDLDVIARTGWDYAERHRLFEYINGKIRTDKLDQHSLAKKMYHDILGVFR
ncbi:hypothetical protein HYV49_00060 [Candidatus Pacearchaeota archaeon]|nr:hypothetical protein [Candidatus Pacearchaeota archaeon]